jgi:HAMP domain-containing protein
MTLRQIRNYIIAFGLVVLGLVALAFYTNVMLNDTMEITLDLTTLQEVVQSFDTIRDALEEERIAIGQYPLTGNVELLTRIENAQATYDEAWAVVVSIRSETMTAQISDIEAVRETYLGLLSNVVDEYQTNPINNKSSARLSEAINFYLQNMDPKIRSFADPEIVTLKTRVDIQREKSLDLLQNTQAATLAGIIISGAALIMAGLAVFSTQRMVVSINKIVDAANAISRGDLDIPIDVQQKGEIGDMAQAIERMRTSLKAAIERLRR